jgi:hypothetical protein
MCLCDINTCARRRQGFAQVKTSPSLESRGDVVSVIVRALSVHDTCMCSGRFGNYPSEGYWYRNANQSKKSTGTIVTSRHIYCKKCNAAEESSMFDVQAFYGTHFKK